MSASPSPRELAELLVRRLNRAAGDLGLTLRGRPLFALASVSVPIDADPDGQATVETNGDIELFDIELGAEEWEDYDRLATALETLAEDLRQHEQNQRITAGALSRAFGPNQNQTEMFDRGAAEAVRPEAVPGV